jgi:tetratricopeptide (TPR) repeat protein
LNDAVADLERRFDADPASRDVTAQLWQLYTTTDKPRQASALLERYFNASPNSAAARMRYADALAQRGDYPAAQPHYERILRDDPFLVDDNGWLIAYSFHEAGRLDQFIALIEQIPPEAGLNVATTQNHYRWILQVAGQLQQLDANAALKLYRHLQEIDAAGMYQTGASDAATRLVIELKRVGHPIDTSASGAARP